MNPRAPGKSTYYDPGQVAYVVDMNHSPMPWEADQKPRLRILTSFGELGEAWAIGTTHDIRHDQTLRNLGNGKVVGTVDFRKFATGDGRVFAEAFNGVVPDRALPHWVFK